MENLKEYRNNIIQDTDLRDYIYHRIKNDHFKFNKDEVVSQFQLTKLFDEKRKGKRHHNPGDIGSCIRALYYAWKGAEIEQTEEDIKQQDEAFAIGIKCHEMITELLKPIFPLKVENWTKNEDLNMLGRMDFEWCINGKWMPVEVKSCSANSLKFKISRSIIDFNHYCQIQSYMFMEDGQVIKSYPLGWLLFINKESCFDNNEEQMDWTLFKVLKDKECWQYIQDKIMELECYLVMDSVPPKPGDGLVSCKYCNYQSKCQEDE